MRTVTQLPEGYREFCFVDLQKDRRTALLVNILSAAVFLVMGIGMNFFVPVSSLFDMSRGLGAYFLRWGVMLAAAVAYIILHELTHAAAMKLFGARKVRFGFTGLYAYAGSLEDYFGKTPYLVIALAPLAVWSVVLTVLCLLVPLEWLWVVWFVQISNVAGAMGDVFVSLKFAGMPADILVRDTGVDMTVFSRSDPAR